MQGIANNLEAADLDEPDASYVLSSEFDSHAHEDGEEEALLQSRLLQYGPLSPMMLNLRGCADTMHARWVSGDEIFARKKLNSASRKQLGILCALMVDCAHAYNRPHLMAWLAQGLAKKRIASIAPKQHRNVADKRVTFNARHGCFTGAGIQSFALSRMLGLAPLSSRFINLQVRAMQLESAWMGGHGEAVRIALNSTNRSDLGLLCALINERINPFVRQHFSNWLECELQERQINERRLPAQVKR